MKMKPQEKLPMRKVLLGMGLILLVILFLGNLLARRLLIFSPEDLIFDAENDYTLTKNLDHSAAIFADTITMTGNIDGHGLFMARVVNVTGAIEDDLIVMGETINFNGTVSGNAVFVGESVRLQGTVANETVVFAEELIVDGDIDGTLVACTGQVANNVDAILQDCNGDAAKIMLEQAGSKLASVWFVSLLQNQQAHRAFNAVLPLSQILFMTGIAALLVAIFPQNLNTVANATRVNPGRMLLTGMFVSLLMIGITVACLVVLAYASLLGLILLPFYLILLVAFCIMLVMGWVTLLLTFGGWLANRISGRMMPPMVQSVLGGFVFTLIAYGLSWLPLSRGLTPLVFFALGLVGLGASYATRMGRRSVLMG